MYVLEPALRRARMDRRDAKQCWRVHEQAVAVGQKRPQGPEFRGYGDTEEENILRKKRWALTVVSVRLWRTQKT